MVTQLAQRASVRFAQQIQQCAAAWVGEGFEYVVIQPSHLLRRGRDYAKQRLPARRSPAAGSEADRQSGIV
ncbi:MAG: hypothetical protein K0S39_2476 [Paenibacillus sp.]|nr:hypothetical protein [Paenibacillus sp.]